MQKREQAPALQIGLGAALLWAAGAIVSFTLAYAFAGCEFLIAGFLACLFPLARLRSRRLAYYFGLGIGFLLMAAAGAAHLRGRARWTGFSLLTAAALYPALIPAPRAGLQKTLRVAGVQMEFPDSATVLAALDDTLARFPGADVLVLSEYTFRRPVPDTIKAWCRGHGKYLVVGAEDPAPPPDYYDTAFVVDTNGAIAFRQGKCVPVQFMKDGLPARQQQLWDSPWGKIGLGVCYDDGYSRVTDELIRQGAQALIFPTMDLADWGEAQHLLHGRVAPMRAAEYGVPIFRVCSSGISQCVDGTGRVLSSAPFPGDGAMLAAEMPLPSHGRMPPDHWLARLSVAVVGALIGWLGVEALLQRARGKARPGSECV